MFPLDQDKCEVRVILTDPSRKISSDVYNCWLEQVKIALMNRIVQLWTTFCNSPMLGKRLNK